MVQKDNESLIIERIPIPSPGSLVDGTWEIEFIWSKKATVKVTLNLVDRCTLKRYHMNYSSN